MVDAFHEFIRLIKEHNEDQITQELCDTVISENVYHPSFSQIPDQFKTRDLCMKYLSRKPRGYNRIPKKYMDKEMWIYIFKLDGEMINRGDIPEEMVNQEMYEIAVVYGRLKLQKVPREYRSMVNCLHVLEKRRYSDVFDYIPDSIRLDKRYHLKLVSANGRYLSHIPLEDRTVDIYKAAIENDAYAARYLPNESEELMPMVAALIKNDKTGEIFGYIPDWYKTRDVCMTAVAIKGKLIGHVPRKIFDREIYNLAISNDQNAAQFIPYKLPIDLDTP